MSGPGDAKAIRDAQGFEHGRRLKLAAEPERNDAVWREAADSPARDADGSAGTFTAIGEASNQGGLARTIGPNETDEFAAPCGKGDTRKHRETAEMFGDVDHLN